MSDSRADASKKLDTISSALDKVAENIQQAKDNLLKKLNTPIFYSVGGDLNEQQKQLDKTSIYFNPKFEAVAKTDSTNFMNRLQWKESTEKHHRLELNMANENPAQVKQVVARVIGNNFTENITAKGKFLVITTTEQEKAAMEKLTRREKAFEVVKQRSPNQEAKKEKEMAKEEDFHTAPTPRTR